MEGQRRVSFPQTRVGRKKERRAGAQKGSLTSPSIPSTPQIHNQQVPSDLAQESTKLKGPLRLTRLCILSIFLPGILIAGPLYLRYRVYSGQMYPVAMSDMRLVDKRISTTWCQKQLVKSNATFNAYLLPEEPQTKPTPTLVTMVRYLDLDDDMKEYWGFYMLKGSSFTVSTCCRWPGAYLTVIKGHKQLRECAYFGDDSSEEEDELEEIRKEKEEKQRGTGSSKDREEGRSNEPRMMRKARPGVVFHGSQQRDIQRKHKMSKEIVLSEDNEHFNDWFPFKSARLNLPNRKVSSGRGAGTLEKGKAGRGEVEKSSQTSFSEVREGAKNATEPPEVGEARNNESEEIYQEVLNKIRGLGHKGKNMLMRLSEKLTVENLTEKAVKKREITWKSVQSLSEDDEDYDAAAEEDEEVSNTDDIRGTFNGTTLNDKSDSEFWSSFSSSEERLINCAGLIVNLPLIPKKACQKDKSDDLQAKAGLANKFTYKVPTNGYYFFVFSSENEIQPNYIRVQFELEKIVYNVSNPVAACTNTTESCSLPLNFFSREKTVLEMPLSNNDSMWNQEFVVVSVCEPRTMVYAACIIAVPVLILLFAF